MDPDQLFVRPARPEDGATLAAIATEAGLSFDAARDLDRPFVVVLSGVDADQVVGFVSVQVVGDDVEILDLAVAAAHRRRGVGRRLVNGVLVTAVQRGAAQVFLEVRRSNAAAVALYQSEGFVEVGRRKRYYRDGEDALLFRLLLGSTT